MDISSWHFHSCCPPNLDLIFAGKSNGIVVQPQLSNPHVLHIASGDGWRDRNVLQVLRLSARGNLFRRARTWREFEWTLSGGSRCVPSPASSVQRAKLFVWTAGQTEPQIKPENVTTEVGTTHAPLYGPWSSECIADAQTGFLVMV